MTDSGGTFATAAASADHTAGLLDLFARAGVTCHCRYWHFEGDTNAWLDRCAHAVERNQEELARGLEGSTDDTSGVVATAAGQVVGWLKLAPVAAVPKLYSQRLYRRLPCFDGEREGVFAVGCVLVDPAHRRRGAAAALIAGAIEVARARGARAIEAFPRRAEPARDDELFTGPFARAGFRTVHEFAPYPVLRLDL